ncbi:hypothetical protein [Microvirga sesbaniae]|uniref:hypothetical protein n=1 Tax=Microvirga sesbaniae TaxID=681392 RepID=UPI0021C8C085|nr:hypothetical protein [Microvirga sp. HBU67692]
MVTSGTIDSSALAGRLRKPHAALHDLLQASQGIRDLDPMRHISGRELMAAQPAGEIGSKPRLPQSNLEHLLAARTGQFDSRAPKILEQAAFSG